MSAPTDASTPSGDLSAHPPPTAQEVPPVTGEVQDTTTWRPPDRLGVADRAMSPSLPGKELPAPGEVQLRGDVPGYEVLGTLGRGGMGIVFKARQLSLSRIVALKMILHAEYTNAEERRRFRAEAESIAQLQHPHIVQVFEVGQHNDLPYFSLEFCPGGSLNKKLKGTPLLPQQAAALVEKLAHGMQAAHAKGIVHRDLKPANVLLAEDGTPRISDFGLAKQLDVTAQTQTGAVMGTPSYMAPEQASGQSKGVGPAADIYALGAILYECLTGRPPFRAATHMDTLMQVVHDEPVPVRRLQPKVPRDVETICHKCLEKEPARRYATAQGLAGDLAAFLAGRPVQARPVRGPERLWKWARRRPAQALLLLMTALALLSLGGGGALVAWQAEQGRQEAEGHAHIQEQLRKDVEESLAQVRIAEQKARDKAENFRQELARSSVLLANHEWDAGNVRRARDLLGEVPPDLRRWEWYYLRRTSQGGYCTLYGHTGVVFSVAFSPDGRRLASASWENTVRLWDARSGQPLGAPLRGHTSPVLSVAFSPDGQRIASSSWDNTVRLWDAGSGQSLGPPLRGHTSFVTSVAFSPDSQTLASASHDKTVRLWNARSGQPLGAPLRGHTHSVLSVTFSPDGKRLASSSWDKTVRLWDARSGQPLGPPLQGHTREVHSVAFSPDGQRLASASADNTVRLWDARSGQPLGAPLHGHTKEVTNVAFGPDGQRLASASADNTVRLWDAHSGQPLGPPLRGHTESVTCVTFSPDDQRLASSSGDSTVHLWDIRSGQPFGTPLHGHTSFVPSVAVSPDGQRLASASWDKTVRLWDVRSGQPLGAPLQGHTNNVFSVVFSPDGRLIASGGWDKTVRLWDARSGQPLSPPLQGHTDGVNSVAFSPDSQRLASAAADSTVRLWDVRSGQPLAAPLRRHTGAVLNVAFSPDGQRLASASGDSTVRLWDAHSGQPLGEPLRGHTSTVSSVAFSPDSQRLASSSFDGTVHLWDVRSGQPLTAPLHGHTEPVHHVVFSPDGQRLATGSWDKTVRLWDAHSGQPLGPPLYGHTQTVSSVVFSPDGQRIASSGYDNTVRLWDARSGPSLATPLRGHTGAVFSVAFSPDGRFLASSSWDNTVRLWDARSGKPFGPPLQGHTQVVFSMAFSPDGNTLWSRDASGIVKAWDIRSGKERTNPGPPPPFAATGARHHAVALSAAEAGARHPSEPLLALPDGNSVLLIDLSPPDADELAFRKGKAAFDPFWHAEQAADAEKNERWFAAVFHRGLVAEHAPWQIDAWDRLEAACGKLGDNRPALAVCDRLLRNDPALAPVYQRRAALRLRTKDVRGACADLLCNLCSSVRDHPDWPEFAATAAEQGKQAAARENWPRAVHHYTLAAAWSPRDPWHLHRLAWALLAAGDEDGSRRVCRRLHARFGNLEGQRDLFTLSALLAQPLQPLTPAPLLAEQAIALDGANRAGVIVRTATLLSDGGIEPVALVALTSRAIAINPASPASRATHGAALYRAGKYQEAIKQLEQATKLQDQGGNNWQKLFLAMAYQRQDDAAKARRWLDTAKLDERAGWDERLLYRRLRQEAEALLRATPGR